MANPETETTAMLEAGTLRVDESDERAWLNETALKLSPKAFKLLLVLMQSPEKLVTKDELIDQVWEGRAVSDAVLTTATRELRHALKDAARTPEFIETVHGRGYRFLKPVAISRRETAAVKQSASTPIPVNGERSLWLLLPVGVVVVLMAVILLFARDRDPTVLEAAESGSVSVMSFENLAGDDELAWFAAGLTEELYSSLMLLPDLQIVRGDDAPSPDTTYQLHGSVRTGEGRIRVAAQLLRTADQSVVWSDRYDRAEDDLISIQEDISLAIAQSLALVTDPEQLRAMLMIGTRSVAAYKAFLKGHAFLARTYESGDVDFRRAAYLAYEEARTLDPNFAEAHWLAARYWHEQSTFIVGRNLVEEAPEDIAGRFRERISRAVETARTEDQRRKYLAAQQRHEFSLRAAIRNLGDYAAVRPNDPDVWIELASVAVLVGDFEVARRAASELVRLTERDPLILSRTIPMHLWARDVDGSVREANRALGVAPGNSFVRYHAHRTLIWAGEFDQARELLPSVLASDMLNYSKALATMRQACADGDRAEAERQRAKLHEDPQASRTSKWLAAMMLQDVVQADAILAELDTLTSLHALGAYARYPHFDPSRFPQLMGRLTADGVTPASPWDLPFACAVSVQEPTNSSALDMLP